MLRMGRSPKTEPAEERQPQHAAQPTTAPPPSQQTYAPPPRAPQPTTTPAPAESLAPAAARETTSGASRAVTESEALARDLREGIVSGFVGAGTTVSGDAEFKGMLRIDGRFSGRVRSEKGTLIVSSGGLVEADVEVSTARINGTLDGDIVASERIEFGRSARVRGNIQTPALVIEEGAIFEGQCRMTPKSAPASKPAATAQAKAAPARPAAPTPAPTPSTAARAAAPAAAEVAG